MMKLWHCTELCYYKCHMRAGSTIVVDTHYLCIYFLLYSMFVRDTGLLSPAQLEAVTVALYITL